MNPERPLNLSQDEIARAGALLTQFLQNFEAAIPARKVLPDLDRASLTDMLDTPFPQHGIGIDGLFDEIATRIMPNATAIAHPRFLAYVQGPPNGIAPVAEAIAAAINQNCNFWQLSPSASVVERKVVSWLASLFDFPASAGGILTSGGSMATLMALSAAIHDRCPQDFRTTGWRGSGAEMVMYTSIDAHRCVEKAVAILGMGTQNLRRIAADPRTGMCLVSLKKAVAQDRASGKLPICVIATSGTVSTGAIDPIDALSDFCRDENMWLHIDGAFGALFVLSDQMKDRLRCCGKADSIALDPHKLLFAPLEAGCLIVRDPEKLRRAFSFSASYIEADDDPLFTNYMDYGVQLSRSFKAFKIWCSLLTFGVKAFSDATDRALDLARYMGRQIDADDAFELLAPVNLTAVCFKLKGIDNKAILARLGEEGTALLGPIDIGGQFGLRACIANYRTQAHDIDLVLERLRALAVAM
jgi:aromatic-L-amino-acid decarboxylase